MNKTVISLYKSILRSERRTYVSVIIMFLSFNMMLLVVYRGTNGDTHIKRPYMLCLCRGTQSPWYPTPIPSKLNHLSKSYSYIWIFIAERYILTFATFNKSETYIDFMNYFSREYVHWTKSTYDVSWGCNVISMVLLSCYKRSIA